MAVIVSLLAALFDVLGVVLGLYMWLLIIGAVLSWLVVFDVVNVRNRFVQIVSDICQRLTEPALRPIRRFVPVVGGVDLSPLVLIFVILFVQSFIGHLKLSMV